MVMLMFPLLSCWRTWDPPWIRKSKSSWRTREWRGRWGWCSCSGGWTCKCRSGGSARGQGYINSHWPSVRYSNYSNNTLLYLHHQEQGIEDDQQHDEVLEGSGDHHTPQLVLEAVPLLRHVALQGFGLDGEVNAGFLRDERFKTLTILTDSTWFLSISPSCSSASPCSWKVMMIRATKMLTKKKGKTIKKTM